MNHLRHLSLLVLLTSAALCTAYATTGKELTPLEQQIVAAADAEEARAIQLLETLVNINSGTMN